MGCTMYPYDKTVAPGELPGNLVSLRPWTQPPLPFGLASARAGGDDNKACLIHQKLP